MCHSEKRQPITFLSDKHSYTFITTHRYQFHRRPLVYKYLTTDLQITNNIKNNQELDVVDCINRSILFTKNLHINFLPASEPPRHLARGQIQDL